VTAPTREAAHEMGANGSPAVEAERLAFEAWMKGHCWSLCATWRGTQYQSDSEVGGRLDPFAVRTRELWAAWRDRAALAGQPAPSGSGAELVREVEEAQQGAINALRALVAGLDATYWSSWQTTANFATQHDQADAALSRLDAAIDRARGGK